MWKYGLVVATRLLLSQMNFNGCVQSESPQPDGVSRPHVSTSGSPGFQFHHVMGVIRSDHLHDW